MLDVTRLTGGSVIYLVGELDMQAEPGLRLLLDREIRQARANPGGEDLTLDLAGVSFMDSSGLQVILWAAREVGPDRSVRLRNVDRTVRRLLEVTGVLDIGNLILERDDPTGDEMGSALTR